MIKIFKKMKMIKILKKMKMKAKYFKLFFLRKK